MILETLALAALLVAQEPELPPELRPVDDWDLELLPGRNIYRAYFADTRQCHTGTKVEVPVRKGDHLKIENTLGTYRPLALWTNADDPEEMAEFFVEGACFSRFDIDEQWDFDAADYKFGFPFVYKQGDIALKFNIYHVTSHLGDEFLSRGADNGRGRLSYHLEEFVFGGAWTPDDIWRVYFESGAALYHGTATYSGRLQLGGEWVGRPLTSWLTPFAGLDLSSRNEQGWDVNFCLAAGLWARGASGSNGMRFAIEYYHGRDTQTQFMTRHETYVAFNVAADF